MDTDWELEHSDIFVTFLGPSHYKLCFSADIFVLCSTYPLFLFCSVLAYFSLAAGVAAISWKCRCAADAVPLYQDTGTHFAGLGRMTGYQPHLVLIQQPTGLKLRTLRSSASLRNRKSNTRLRVFWWFSIVEAFKGVLCEVCEDSCGGVVCSESVGCVRE